MIATYRDAIAYLDRLEGGRGWDLGLERIRRVLALRGNPERRVRVLHVAGTNGKGTVAAILEAVLRAAGVRTGLYTSPHLVDFAERIRAGGRTMPEDAVTAGVEELRAWLARRDLVLTHFEFVTVLAFDWFARVGVEVAVVEVGLGGRLDATNVVRPLVTLVTSIALDHEEFLGSGVVAVAREKAGVVKPGVPLVVGLLAPEADAAIARVAADRGAPMHRLGVDAALTWRGDVLDFEGLGVRWTSLTAPGSAVWQRSAMGVALLGLAAARAHLPVGEASVRCGLRTVSWPGRLAVVPGPTDVVLDGAHNPAGTRALAAELPAVLGGRRARLLFACGRDRRWDAMVAALAPWTRHACVAEVGRRPAPAADVATAFARRAVPAEVGRDPQQVFAALRDASDGAPILVTGSLFLVGAVYSSLVERLWGPWQGWELGATGPPP